MAAPENLAAALERASRRRRLKGLALALPLMLFLGFFFIAPLGAMLMRSLHSPDVAEALPQTLMALEAWDASAGPPGDAAYEALVAELRAAVANDTVNRIAGRLKFERAGARALIVKTARALSQERQGSARDILIAVDRQWGTNAPWAAIAISGREWSIAYYVQALDLRYDDTLAIVQEVDGQRIYLLLFLRTAWVSLTVTLLALVLGFPVAWLLAHARPHISDMLMVLVLLPFWTSILVRTTAWIAMLQQQGVVNDMLVWAGIVADNGRLEMMYNMTGTLVAMTHVLLPFMILPLYSVMKTIPPTYVRAARSLGAGPVTAFVKVYLPLTLPGIGAGSILVFILAAGYYITPTLVGGRTGQLISNQIAFHMQQSLNWGLAAAIGGLLLAAVILLYFIFQRAAGHDRLRFG
ncbi:MAG TPA: ABC transporter permease [Micropepsaceae bacterium]|nr:ABC transporter permease [Micropepsaceae bacterium]